LRYRFRVCCDWRDSSRAIPGLFSRPRSSLMSDFGLKKTPQTRHMLTNRGPKVDISQSVISQLQTVLVRAEPIEVRVDGDVEAAVRLAGGGDGRVVRVEDRPSPTPSRTPVLAPMRRNGPKSEVTASSGTNGPLLAISRYAVASPPSAVLPRRPAGSGGTGEAWRHAEGDRPCGVPHRYLRLRPVPRLCRLRLSWPRSGLFSEPCEPVAHVVDGGRGPVAVPGEDVLEAVGRAG